MATTVPIEPDAPSPATAEADPAGLPLTPLFGWGAHPVVEGYERFGEDLERITEGVVLTRGLGRSYGDASLPPPGGHVVANTTLADRLLAFDSRTGVMRAEAGFPLWRLNRLFFARGWFTPVSPGTHYVTLGGMAAADVHGKNHHKQGCFGAHVQSLRMRLADGEILECADDREPDLFRATLGGMGLTGHILEITFRMQRIASPWMWEESEQIADFDAVLERLQEAGKTWPYTVCWADFMGGGRQVGRGLLMKARWAEPLEAPSQPPRWRRALTVPFQMPDWLLQRWMIMVGTELKYRKHGSGIRRGIINPETSFYPLDVAREWSRFYGRRGFTQHQSVLPGPASHPRHRRLLEILTRHRAPVFLCVIKDCGPEGKGMLSFPKPGISYALDLPVYDGLQRVIDAVNEHVAAEGGRVYLAKDAFTRAEHFRAMEDRLDAFTAVRRKWDPHGRLKSAQSIRLLGDPP